MDAHARKSKHVRSAIQVKSKYYSSTTLYYKILLCTTPYYKVLRLYYSVLESTKYYSSTTPYYKVLRQYYSVLEGGMYYSVLLCTTPAAAPVAAAPAPAPAPAPAARAAPAQHQHQHQHQRQHQHQHQHQHQQHQDPHQHQQHQHHQRQQNVDSTTGSRDRHVRSYERVHPTGTKSSNYYSFARSTRTILRKGCTQHRKIAIFLQFRAIDTYDLTKRLLGQVQSSNYYSFSRSILRNGCSGR